ncbi:MAG: coproporphyrinogen III oxidase, partial [Sulfuricellaceae bacterium]
AADEIELAQKNKTLYRNFQGYTTHKDCDLYAFGASSISQTEDVFVQNHKDLKRYQALVEEGRLPIERGLRVTAEDKLRRDAITRIMCDLELDKAAFGRQWNIDFDVYFADALAELQAMEGDGLVEMAADRISVTSLGRIFLRNIAMPFDAYLKKKTEDRPMFSKTL